MPRYVALLRGINVGGKNLIKMADLKACLEDHGLEDVATYIQSGNVVLTSPLDAKKLRGALETAIAEQLGVSPVVVIRTRRQLADVIAGNPFADADTDHLHVAFLSEQPDASQVAGLAELDHPPEDIAVRGTEAYFLLPNGLGRAKIPELFGRRVKTPATVRNWRTVNKLLQMSAN
jgi:uncharacterized protein (DUF1697 family)